MHLKLDQLFVFQINKKLGEAANVEREICKRMVSGHGNEVNRK